MKAGDIFRVIHDFTPEGCAVLPAQSSHHSRAVFGASVKAGPGAHLHPATQLGGCEGPCGLWLPLFFLFPLQVTPFPL